MDPTQGGRGQASVSRLFRYLGRAFIFPTIVYVLGGLWDQFTAHQSHGSNYRSTALYLKSLGPGFRNSELF